MATEGVQQLAAALSSFRDKPVEFMRRLWPGVKLWKKQQEIAESVAGNYGTIVHSAIETGKGFIAARLILWFYATRFPCKVVATSITAPQLRDSLWGEIDSALRQQAAGADGEKITRPDGEPVTVKELLGIDVIHMELRRLDEKGQPHGNDWVRLRVAKDVEGMHGIHLPPLPDGGPTVFILLDECSGISDKFIDALKGQAHVILVLGNPLNLAGQFARMIRAGSQCDPLHPGRWRWYVIHIDGIRTPNVATGMKWDRLGRKGPLPSPPIPGIMSYPSWLAYNDEWDDYNITTRLRGRLPEGDETRVVVPRVWLDRSFLAWDEIDPKWRRENLARWMGVDASHGRGDLAVWWVIDALGTVDVRAMDPEAAKDKEYGQPDTVKMLELTQDLMQEHGISPGRVAVDAGGGGQDAIGDPLRREGKVVQLVDFGAAPSKSRRRQYTKRRSELYGLLAEACNPTKWRRLEGDDGKPGRWEVCFAMPATGPVGEQCQALADELPMIPKLYDREGKMYLPPKSKRAPESKEQTLREILGHSPDRSDAAALAVWAMRGGTGTPTVSRSLVLTEEEPGGDEPERSDLVERIFGPATEPGRGDRPWTQDDFWGE
jgi:hypothetical protein